MKKSILGLSLTLWLIFLSTAGLTILGGYGYLKLTGGTMTGVLFNDVIGSCAGPNFSRSIAPTTGYYIATGGNLGICSAGTELMHFLNTTGVSDPRACATNFTRVGVNTCFKTTAAAAQAAIPTSCTAINLTSTYGIPATAKTVLVKELYNLNSGTVAGLETVQLFYYSENTCTTPLATDGLSYGNTVSAWISDTTAGHTYNQFTTTRFIYHNGAATVWAKMIQTIVTGGGTAAVFGDAFEYTE